MNMSVFDMSESCSGKIVIGVNTTPDVGPQQITIESEKFMNKVSEDGYPPVIEYYNISKSILNI